MRPNTLRATWAKGEAVVSAWLSIPSSYAAELMAHQGFDAVIVDLQHGMVGFETAVTMLQAISTTATVPMARVSGNDPALVMQLLDAGAYGIICPMISSAEEAEKFVAACRYPPRGNRSFGPARGVLYGGPDYFTHADREVVVMAMIETREGLDALDAILAVPGLDGIFIGPNDLALALGAAPRSESDDEVVVHAIAGVLARTRAAGKAAGIFCSGGDAAAARIAEGFSLVIPGNDAAMLALAAHDALAKARPGRSTSSSGGSGY